MAEINEISALEMMYWQVYFKLDREEFENSKKKSSTTDLSADQTLD